MEAQRGESKDSSELDLLRQRITSLEADNTRLKQIIEEIANLRIENTKLKQIIKQNRTTNDPLQFQLLHKRLFLNPNNILNHKSTEEKKLDDFLNQVTKEKVSNLMRDRNQEKKLLQSNEDPTSEDITAEAQRMI
ncbi:7726_t:CDS:2 [Entrophospora sp. SA101]|nr:7726_t:CDS:2 [Entrophospora sp. SA101]